MIYIIIIFTIKKYIMPLNILYLYTILLPSDAYECNLSIVFPKNLREYAKKHIDSLNNC